VHIVIARLAPIIGGVGGLGGWFQGFLVLFLIFFCIHTGIFTQIQYIHDIHFHFHYWLPPNFKVHNSRPGVRVTRCGGRGERVWGSIVRYRHRILVLVLVRTTSYY